MSFDIAIDDILVTGTTDKAHLDKLEEVLMQKVLR